MRDEITSIGKIGHFKAFLALLKSSMSVLYLLNMKGEGSTSDNEIWGFGDIASTVVSGFLVLTGGLILIYLSDEL